MKYLPIKSIIRKYLHKLNLEIITLIEDADNENCNFGTKFGEK